MKLRSIAPLLFISTTAICLAQSDASFPALEQWKAAVIRGDAIALKAFYSSDPPARINTSSTELTADVDVSFWTGLKARRVDLKIAQSNSPQPGAQQIVFQAEIKPAPPAHTVYVSVAQLWQQQAGVWKLIAAKRTDTAKLEQPLSLDAKIYPSGVDAHE